ncbi:22657_t:CDS:1, partial [Racocetra persica]
KLPGYKQYSGAIEKILQQHHKTQKRTATINASLILKALNHARINKNTRVNE